jgi:hypothetical protein
LVQRFGDAYRDYQRSVPKLIPLLQFRARANKRTRQSEVTA